MFFFLRPFRWLLPVRQFICRTPCIYSSFLVSRSCISHRVSSLVAQTSRRRYSLVQRVFLAAFPANATRAHDGGDRWLEDGWTELWRLGGQENGRRDARRRAPAVLDSGQRPRCLSGEMAEKGNRARGWGGLPTYYVFSRYFRQVRPVLWRKKGPL